MDDHRRSGIPRFDTTTRFLRIVGTAFLTVCLGTPYAYAEHPPGQDPSGLTKLVIDADGEALEGLPDANLGTFEGGNTGHAEDAEASNVLQPEDQRPDEDAVFNIPTNAPPSPLFGARPFTQQMLRFEEFGTADLDLNADEPGNWEPLPAPATAQSAPDGSALEGFLAQPIWPNPTVFANETDLNPWQAEIESYLGRSLDDPPAEGRPPGLGWSHQRWDDFTPTRYFQTAMAGARVNGGFRDSVQSHGYSDGEFGPGGLYHNTVGARGFDGTTEGIAIKFHPNCPTQDQTALWTFDGTLPPKLLNARYGETLLFRHYNALPIDVAANRGFGVHTISTHEHNGHNPAESDGYANSFFFPGQFYDYRWPMTIAGSDTINTDADDPRAGSPDGSGGITNLPGDWRETMSTHWFHDHMLDFTAQNVYKGNAAMMNYYSAIDRGNEAIDDGVNLRFPSGTAQDWGNRDYDVNLLVAEKAWDGEGQLWFNPFNLRGFAGDVMTVNWLYKPYMEVRARKYRFRILNGSVSRFFKLALVDSSGTPVPFYMIANDGNIMEHTVHFPDGTLPTQGIAERYDIIVDFSQFKKNEKLYLVNLLQHKDGESTDVAIPLADVVSGVYSPAHGDCDGDKKTGDCWVNGDPVVGKFLEFRVVGYDGEDLSMDPAQYAEGGDAMIPLRMPTEAELANALHRTFEFEAQPTDEKPWVIETDGGKAFGMDPRRVSAAPSKNSGGLEVWSLVNSGTWSHPIHIHFEEGIILRRNGVAPPEHEKWARKDVYRLGPQPDSGDLVEVALRFREFAGTYMEHCHNTQHEDHAMLLRWDIENPGQVKLMPTPIPSWDGISYVDSVALPTFREGDGVGDDGGIELDPLSVWIDGVTISHFDNIRDEPIGDALDPNDNNERGGITFELEKGINIDADGNEREVYFIMHDVSDEELSEELGIAWGGGLRGVNPAATAEASVKRLGVGNNKQLQWTFYGDLPNPIWANPACRVGDPDVNGEPCLNDANIPDVSDTNTYSPLRSVNIDGKDVVFNAIFMQWGDEDWEQNRTDRTCNSFPDSPPNTTCAYNGTQWGRYNNSGHVVEMNTDNDPPYVTLKLHKSWASEHGDYLPYYIVVDTFPAPPARAMGVPYVPKHEFLGTTAVPLVQWMPGKRHVDPTFPPMPQPATADGGEYDCGPDGCGINGGGGPFGSQVGLPSYFMPEDDYSPMWHIGFAHWLEPHDRVVKGLKELRQLRKEGRVEILEWPAPPRVAAGDNDKKGIRVDDYDFANPNSPHVVNCPTPVTLDAAIHRARNAGKF